MKYTYTKLPNGNYIAEGENGKFKIINKPYRMSTEELDFDNVEFENEFVENDIIFYDGYAVDNEHQILLIYRTLESLMNGIDTDWSGADFYDDGQINFYQIQYEWHLDQKVGKEEIEKWLKENTNLLAERTYRVSVPFFVLPYLDVKADTPEKAKKQYKMMVEDILSAKFPKGCDVRLLNYNDVDEGWEVKDVTLAR